VYLCCCCVVGWLAGGFDVVLMELGVLHYFVDLQPLMLVVQQLLAPGGRFVLREFHPVSTKLITTRGKKHKVTGTQNGSYLEADAIRLGPKLYEAIRRNAHRLIQAEVVKERVAGC
jgi:SAM-dependent methyltransferase